MAIIALDYETHLISGDSPIPKPVCLSWYDGKDTGLLIGEDIPRKLEEWLSADTFFIAHNAAFELQVTFKYYPHLRNLILKCLDRGKFFCTQIYQQLLDNQSKTIEKSHTLANLADVYLGIDLSEEKTDPNAWRLRYSELDGVPISDWPKEAVDYAINDSVYAYQVFNKQRDIRSDLDFKAHVYSAFFLNYMSERGFVIDKSRVELLSKEIDNYLNPVYEYLKDHGYVKVTKAGNYSKNIKKLREHIQEHFTELKHTDSGTIQTSKDALQNYLTIKNDGILKMFLNINKFEKAKTAFVHRLLEVKDVIRTSYNPIVRSGRTSSRANSIYPSVNIQQQPRTLHGVTWDIRNCYLPRPGYKLVTIDYNNLELISCAHQLSKHGESALKKLINSGDKPVDLHSAFACKLMSVDISSNSVSKDISYEHFIAHKKEDEYAEYRRKGKPITLGAPGGMGYDTIRKTCVNDDIHLKFEPLLTFHSEEIARRVLYRYAEDNKNVRVARTGKRDWSIVKDEVVHLKNLLFELYPELGMFLKETHKEFLTGEIGYKKNEWGEWEEEPYYSYNTHGVKRNYCNYTAFCNGYLMQTPSAAGAKLAGWNLFKEYHRSDEVHILAFIHDEYIFEIKDNDRLLAHVEKCANIMIESMKETLPGLRVAVEAEVKPYWSKSLSEWSKVFWQ